MATTQQQGTTRQQSTQQLQPFSLKQAYYDNSTFMGRFKYYMNIFDPRHAMADPRQINDYKKLLDDVRQMEQDARNKGEQLMLSEKEIQGIRKAMMATGTAINPNTQQMIPWATRFSSFMLMSLPLSYGLVLASPSKFNTFLWLGAAQTYSTGLNYANASGQKTNADLMAGWIGAVATSVLLGLVLKAPINRYMRTVSRGTMILGNSIVNSIAFAAGGIVNAFIMREQELRKGINLYDEEDNYRGKSKTCARKALIQNIQFRTFLSGLTILTPGALLFLLHKANKMPRFIPKFLTEITFLSAFLLIGLPISMAAFKMQGSVNAQDLGPEFQNINLSNGKKAETLYFNKGL